MKGISLCAFNRVAAFRRYCYVYLFLLVYAGLLLCSNTVVLSQSNQPYATTYPAPQQTASQTATKQEIARLDIKVVRGEQTLPITQVPRVQKGDVLKVKLLDEPVSGIKIDQTKWDWTLVVAYANPLINSEKQETASPEVRFRKTGWYKEYSFNVPFDCQPVFFLSPRANFRGQVLKAVSKNFGELQKIGEKMVEISGAYAQISTFLTELQTVINQNQYGYNYNNPYANSQSGQYASGYNYSVPGVTNYYNTYGNAAQSPFWLDQAVERLAKSFNIQMPDCWRSGYNSAYSYPSGTYSGSYNTPYSVSGSYGASGSYNSGVYGTGGIYGTGGFNAQDFIARSQCVAKTVRLEDFDLSITRIWQQGGVFVAAELQKKYPQLAYYINIAAAAIDFIVKVFQKAPLRIVPTLITSTDSQSGAYPQTASPTPYQNSFQTSGSAPGLQSAANSAITSSSGTAKISVFSSQQPTDQGFLTAYPIVVQKWQSNPDSEAISLHPPVLYEPCLHAGINVFKDTNLTSDWASDTFTRDFNLALSSPNGFRKEYPLRKNIGLSGWELNLTPQDMAEIPKVDMTLEAVITGARGFNKLSSPKLSVSIASSGKWELASESQQAFSVGGRRRITLQNSAANCRCLQSVTYKPSFGGQFIFETGERENNLQISMDGREASFEIDSTKFQPGQSTLEIKTYGGETTNLNIKTYPAAPKITNLRAARGDRELLISGERLDQVRYIIANGFKATIQPSSLPADSANPDNTSKLAVFDDPYARLLSNSVSLELGLEDERRLAYLQTFGVLPARPAIISDASNEIEGISDVSSATGAKSADANSASLSGQFASRNLSVFPIKTSNVSLTAQNTLNDYEFKNENIVIEAKIEGSQEKATDFLKTEFEVLDTKTIRLNFYLFGDIHPHLGGRRIQFRIKDKNRGDSDWYTIKQTFVRLPKVSSIKCTDEMGGMCEMKGEGMDYVGQVSIDGGASWYPQEPAKLSAQPMADGLSKLMIPQLTNKKLLQIRLRDFPIAGGLSPLPFAYLNAVKTIETGKTTVITAKPTTVISDHMPIRPEANKPPVDSKNPGEPGSTPPVNPGRKRSSASAPSSPIR